MQNVSPLTLNTSRIAAPPAPKTLDEALASHIIEAELKGKIPRHLVVDERPRVCAIMFVVLVAAATVIIGLGLGSLLFTLFWIILLLAAVGSVYVESARVHREHKELLQYGIAKAAVVIQVEPISEGNTVRVTFTYETAASPRLLRSIDLSETEVSTHGLQQGASFTLLMNLANDQDVLPYFWLKKYALQSPTNAMARPSVPVAPTATGPIAAEIGVEPELFCPAPRRVVWTRGVNRARVALANLYAAACVAAVYLFRGMPETSHASIVSACIAAAIPPFGWWVWEHGLWRARYFLRYGHAVLATVTECAVDEMTSNIQVSFRYTRSDSDTEYQEIILTPAEAARWGGMAPGTVFTALRHPSEPYEVVPYFQVKGVEIPGIGEPRVQPPLAPNKP